MKKLFALLLCISLTVIAQEEEAGETASLQETAAGVDTAQASSAEEEYSPAHNNAAILESAEAEETASMTEAGKYERKSVTYIDALWLMDQSVRGMPADYVSYTLGKIKEKLTMPRFDYNPLPEALISDFVAQANASEELTIDSIAELMDQTVVPKILEIVDLRKELRAEAYTSEAQRNSFYATKAKEYGFSDVELAKIMNAAFIYIPVAKKYAGVTADGNYTMKMDVGILWYRISTRGENAAAKLVVKKMTTSMGFAKEKATAFQKNPRQFAFNACVKNAARNLLVATQEMPEFRLSGQAIEVDNGMVGVDLGYKEGLHVDDKYRIVEFEETSDGGVRQANNGWVLVTKVADSNSEVGYKSMAKVVAGDPMTGAVLSEFPRIPIDIQFKLKSFPYSNASEGIDGSRIASLAVSGGFGFQANAQYNIGRHLKIPQLFFDFGFGMGGGAASGTAVSVNGSSEISGVSNTCFDFSLVKKYYLGRLALILQPVFGIQSIAFDAGELSAGFTTYYYRLTNYASGFALNVGGEYAITPSINFGVGLGYQMYGTSSDWDFEGKMGSTGDWESLGYTISDEVGIDHSGVGFQFYLTYSPPSLPFDPIDYIRGRLGI